MTKREDRWQRLVLAATGLVVLIVLPLYAYKVWQKTDYTDFSVYYRAALRARAGDWAHIYYRGDGASPYRYAPMLLPFFRPFAELGPAPARLAWYLVQFAAFALGFAALARAIGRLKIGGRRSPALGLAISGAAFLYVLRFCLDCFTIGQVSSLMFLGFALAVSAWMLGRPALAGLGLFVPTMLKIGPGFGYVLFFFARPRDRRRALTAAALGAAGVSALTLAYLGSRARFVTLFGSWMDIVRADSVYYDASHYGSQSLKSFLLRAAHSGWLSMSEALSIHLALVVLVCALVGALFALRRPRAPLGRGLFFAVALFPYLWCMPETFKYSLTTVAIPVALLLASQLERGTKRGGSLDRFAWSALGFGALTLSLPGKDVVGDTIFFGIQRASLPLLSTLFLGAACVREAWRRSLPSPLGRVLRQLLGRDRVAPWPELPLPLGDAGGAPEISVLVPLPLFRQTRLARGKLGRTLGEYRAALSGRRAELILIPYGDRISDHHPLMAEALALLRETRENPADRPGSVLLRLAAAADGRGTALRSGFLVSRGRELWLTNVEQPCEAAFYLEGSALRANEETLALVRGNRRLRETRFKVPVRLLSLVYGRHRLGLAFNRLVRLVLPIDTTDTHSGLAVIGRELATEAFALQSSPDFLFDLELCLTARMQGARTRDLPVVLYLSEEKSASRMAYETLSILIGLPLLFLRCRAGCYGRAPAPTLQITADDWGISPAVNRGILRLARQGIVKRVSLMAGCRYLREGLDELRATGVELGLHFNLTYGPVAIGPAGAKSPGRLLLRWLKSPHGAIAQDTRLELEAQLRALEAAGVRPTYLDGHHHVHLIPGVLRSVEPVLRQWRIGRARLPYDPKLLFSPRFPLAWLALYARRELERQALVYLPFVYPSPALFSDQGRLQARLAVTATSEVIVHPAESDDHRLFEHPDPYTDGRVVEYRALRMLGLRREAQP